jgi:type II secretion system protein G
MKKQGFTLIELLIVVLIIAILAAIAVPNFLEAQVRAKVSRAKADMRSIATALEAYYVDNQGYPNDIEYGWPWYLTYTLTTPIQYLTSKKLEDPFRAAHTMGSQDYWRLFRYINYPANNPDQPWSVLPSGSRTSTLTIDGITIDVWSAAVNKYGLWRLNSIGPDRYASYDNGRGDVSDTGPGWPWFSNCMVYDPTNGTISCGDIMRSQRLADVWSIESGY